MKNFIKAALGLNKARLSAQFGPDQKPVETHKIFEFK
jgi:hypothetical protein